jgi:hypothetical protein
LIHLNTELIDSFEYLVGVEGEVLEQRQLLEFERQLLDHVVAAPQPYLP